MYEISNLEYLGVKVISQGSYVSPNYILIVVLFGLLLSVLLGIYFQKKYHIFTTIPNETEEKEKLRKASISTFIGLFFLLLTCTMSISFIVALDISSSEPSTLETLTENEYVIELTENTDLTTLTKSYSIYNIDTIVVARKGYCSDRWSFNTRTDNSIPLEIFNTFSK